MIEAHALLRQACTQGAAWLAAGHKSLRLAVNVSVRQMAAENFVTRIAGIIEDTGFPAEWLEIEITESTLQTIEHSQGLLYRLRALGVSIAIDDFGTGFSSFGLLKHLCPSTASRLIAPSSPICRTTIMTLPLRAPLSPWRKAWALR